LRLVSFLHHNMKKLHECRVRRIHLPIRDGGCIQRDVAKPVDAMLPSMLPNHRPMLPFSAQDVANLHARLATCRGAVKYAERILCHLSLFLSLNCTKMATWCLSVSSGNHSIKTIAIQNSLRHTLHPSSSIHPVFSSAMITLPESCCGYDSYLTMCFFLNYFWLF